MVEELIYYKVLPFAVYGKKGELVFGAGETLTPEKIVILRNMPVIYKSAKDAQPATEEAQIDDMINKLRALDNKTEAENIPVDKSDGDMIVEKFDFMRPVTRTTHSYIDNINIDNYKGPLNKDSVIDYDIQIKIKAVFIKALQLFQSGESEKALELFLEVRSKINEELNTLQEKIHKCSELLFLGEYNNCHLLNAAMLATALGMKLGFKGEQLHNLTLAALLHDIGKYRMNAMEAPREHVYLGYEIIKNEFRLPKSIAVAVLEHHENNDGSGYPKSLSGDQINIVANIINICSTFDNMIFNRTNFKIENNREALREMLNIGTSMFMPDLFYTFIHMFSYNDVKTLKEMLIE